MSPVRNLQMITRSFSASESSRMAVACCTQDSHKADACRSLGTSGWTRCDCGSSSRIWPTFIYELYVTTRRECLSACLSTACDLQTVLVLEEEIHAVGAVAPLTVQYAVMAASIRQWCRSSALFMGSRSAGHSIIDKLVE